jgi:hypothetical protein
MRCNPRVALVTCRELPQADPDTRQLIAPLAKRGLLAVPVVWDDPDVDWDAFDLAIVRSSWDYAARRAEFLDWAARVPRLANESHVLEWNTDKHYLAELATRGVPVVPTTWVHPDGSWYLPPASNENLWVVKPAVSLCALDTGRYDLGNPDQRSLAVEHVRRLQAKGRVVMIQPYLKRIDSVGETSLIFIAGRFSHAVRKGAVLDGPDRGIDNRFVLQGGLDLQHRGPSRVEMSLALRALAAVPCPADRLLYARVDLVPGDDGPPVVLEIELTEPQLFFGLVRDAAERFASAIAARIERDLVLSLRRECLLQLKTA